MQRFGEESPDVTLGRIVMDINEDEKPWFILPSKSLFNDRGRKNEAWRKLFKDAMEKQKEKA